jgi:uncharacterized protein (TIGR02246 family)
LEQVPTDISTGVEAMKTIYAAILCVLLVLIAACAQKVNDPADVQAIKDTLPLREKAWNSGNAEGFASGFYAVDAIKMNPNQPALVGKEAISASLQKFFDQYTSEDRNVAEEVRVSGDLAVARGRWEEKSSLKAGGYSVQDEGKWIAAYQRQADGSWKTFWDIYNSDLPVADALAVGEEEQALMQVERDWAAANANNDWAALDKILAAEHVGNDDGAITPKKQLLANMKRGALKITSSAAGEMKAVVLGDTGIVHGLWTEKSIFNGKETSQTNRYTDIFVKRDGRWQCVTTHATKVQ